MLSVAVMSNDKWRGNRHIATLIMQHSLPWGCILFFCVTFPRIGGVSSILYPLEKIIIIRVSSPISAHPPARKSPIYAPYLPHSAVPRPLSPLNCHSSFGCRRLPPHLPLLCRLARRPRGHVETDMRITITVMRFHNIYYPSQD